MNKKAHIIGAAGLAIALSSLGNVANAASNPFASQSLLNPYNLSSNTADSTEGTDDKSKPGKCGSDGKCGHGSCG